VFAMLLKLVFFLARQEIINLPVLCCFVYQDSYGWHPDSRPDFGSGLRVQTSDPDHASRSRTVDESVK